ncbi:MAG: recombinase, partial [Clostridia bacterium]|nr:recombinase [Clostridia bacterium]
MESKLQAESKETLRVKRKQLEKDEKRIQELDRLFIRLYEDNVASRITDDRFTMMSQAYESEQYDLKAEAEVLRQEIETQEQQNQNLEQFIQK